MLTGRKQRVKGKLLDALYLFACRLAWLRHGDQSAQHELIRAAEHEDPEIRGIAAALLVDSATAESRNHHGDQRSLLCQSCDKTPAPKNG